MSEPINCGRCAHLWNRKNSSFGVCACFARQELTGQLRPSVALDATCEHAELSAKFDPEFMAKVRASRPGYVPQPSILSPVTAADSSREDDHGKTYL